MKSLEELEVLEWSPSQKCFHIQTVKKMLEDNRSVFLSKGGSDYLPIGIFATDEDLERFKESAYRILERNEEKTDKKEAETLRKRQANTTKG
jgi:hypothetical protein